MYCGMEDPEEFIASGVEIKVVGIAGDHPLLTYKVTEPIQYRTLAYAFVLVLAKKQNIPRRCVSLAWEWVCQNSQTAECKVTYVATTLTEDEEYTDDECFVCGDPCHDADDAWATSQGLPTREQNCAVCEPCWLCSDCRIQIQGAYYCYDCIQDNQATLIKQSGWKRMKLVCPGKVKELEAALLRCLP